MQEKKSPTNTRKIRNNYKLGLALFLSVFILTMYVRVQLTPPASFTGNTSFEVQKGMSVRDIARAAQEQELVRSSTLLYVILTYSYDPTKIYAGTYLFTEPTSVYGVAQKLAAQDITNDVIRVTIPEGVSAVKIAEIVEEALPDFVADDYLEMAKDSEGYLFPETYFVPETFTAIDLLNLQKETYEEYIAPLRSEIEASGMTEYEVLILASLIEREANDETSMKMVSGVLQNRLAINMALQADASIEYILNKPLAELTADDLKIDSPYNTYLNQGLVPTPIGNPGVMAIDAALHPTASENFFYITAPDGTFYYAETFDEHNENIAKYLR